MQIYIKGQALIGENTSSDFPSMISFIGKQVQSKKTVNDTIERAIGNYFNEALDYMDTKRDRNTVIALFERFTSVIFVSEKLKQVKTQEGHTVVS